MWKMRKTQKTSAENAKNSETAGNAENPRYCCVVRNSPKLWPSPHLDQMEDLTRPKVQYDPTFKQPPGGIVFSGCLSKVTVKLK